MLPALQRYLCECSHSRGIVSFCRSLVHRHVRRPRQYEQRLHDLRWLLRTLPVQAAVANGDLTEPLPDLMLDLPSLQPSITDVRSKASDLPLRHLCMLVPLSRMSLMVTVGLRRTLSRGPRASWSPSRRSRRSGTDQRPRHPANLHCFIGIDAVKASKGLPFKN